MLKPEKMYRVLDENGLSTGVHIFGHYLEHTRGVTRVLRLDERGFGHTVASTGLQNSCSFEDTGLTTAPNAATVGA